MARNSSVRVNLQALCGGLPWRSKYKYYEFKKLCRDRDCILNFTLEDWSKYVKVKTSCVSITCSICNVKVKKASIHVFTKGYLNCGYRYRAESRVRNFLQDTFGDDNILPGTVDWCRNEKTKSKRYLPFDMIIDHFDIIVEVDGPQHYKIIQFFEKK